MQIDTDTTAAAASSSAEKAKAVSYDGKPPKCSTFNKTFSDPM